MLKSIIRLLSFCGKELNEIRRQPRLLLSLVLGPFLVLLLFGIGYQQSQPIFRTAIVLPPEGVGNLDPEVLKKTSLNFDVVSIDSDRERALQALRAGQLDIVQIFPPNVSEQALRGEPSLVEFKYNEINPVNEGWIRFLAYAEVVEINRAILLNTTSTLQSEASSTATRLRDVRQQLEALESGVSSVDSAELQVSLRQLKQASGLLAISALTAPLASPNGEQLTQAELLELQRDLDQLDQALANGELAQQQAQIRTTRERIARIEQVAETVSKLPPAVVVAPLQEQHENLNGRSYEVMIFYAPGVLALLVQHCAVTLAALSLVRERLLGTLEVFQVAPVTASQMLLGKYLAYTLFIGLIVAVLVPLLRLLNVPLPANLPLFAGLVLLLVLAALGVGFVISAVSRSDSQAVQLSMLVLLLSIFFGGFVLPLENFWQPVQAVGYALPLTHGIDGLQALMLRGTWPALETWVGLGSIAGVTLVVALLLWYRQLRKA